jgi:DNA-binding response OmpR family regulator
MTNTVLYIEDNENNIRLIERILKRRPAIELVVATSGGQGLHLAQDKTPRLILLDRRLPDTLGNDVLRHLKASTHTATIPIVVISGDSGREQAAEILKLGADEFLSKPFDVSHLLTMVDRYCG